MCGIAGVLLRGGDVPPAHLVRLSECLQHRGPDSFGYLLWNGTDAPAASSEPGASAGRLAFVHTRLSIIDLTPRAWQPMVTPDGLTALAYNGEVYNYPELRKELEALGHSFTSDSDTEVLLRGYVEWRQEVFARVVGMFAVAILDTRRRRLVLARDFAGIKPLFLAKWQGGLAFASEIPALLELPQVSRRADPQSVLDYLRHEVVDHGDRTFFRDVRSVPGGTALEVDVDTAAVTDVRPFWSVPTQRRTDIPWTDAVATTRDLFLRSVELHLRADVPVGVALSGGVDSSSIAAAVRHIGGPDLDLRTYSYIPTGHALSEERWIRVVIEATRARSAFVHPTASDLAGELSAVVQAQGEPVGGPSVFAQYRVFRAARQDGVIVMLDGQGADEVLAGYRPMAVARLAELLRRGRIRTAVRLASSCTSSPSDARRLLKRAGRRVAGAVVPARLGRAAHGRPDWLDADALAALGAVDESHTLRGSQSLGEELDRYFDTKSLPHLLRYEDRNSMAWSLESRVPFLTPELVTWFLSLPAEFLLSDDGTTKAVFRAAMRGITPDAVLDRTDKLGFEVPVQDWLMDDPDWVRSTLSECTEHVRGLRADAVLTTYDAMAAGSAAFDPAVWRWVDLVVWARTFGVEWD